MNMNDLDNTPTTKPKCDPLTRVLKRFILIVVCVPAFIGAWVYVSPKSFELVLMDTSKFIRYEILGEQIVRDGTIAQQTKEELLDYLESLPKEEKDRIMPPEKYEIFLKNMERRKNSAK